MGVGREDPDAFSNVRRSDVVRSHNHPFRIVPCFGKVTEDSGKSSFDEVVAVTNSETNEVLKNLQGKDFVNKETGIAAQLRSAQRGKLVSNKAAEKSIANGFTREQHNTAAANIGALFERAHLFFDGPDKDGDPNIKSIKRFAALIILGKGPAEADILVKESISSGSRIYTVELQEIKKPSARGTESIKTDRGESQSTPPTTDGRHKVAEEAAKVNRILRIL